MLTRLHACTCMQGLLHITTFSKGADDSRTYQIYMREGRGRGTWVIWDNSSSTVGSYIAVGGIWGQLHVRSVCQFFVIIFMYNVI